MPAAVLFPSGTISFRCRSHWVLYGERDKNVLPYLFPVLGKSHLPMPHTYLMKEVAAQGGAGLLGPLTSGAAAGGAACS